jgi:hypothetical protein
MNPSKHEMSVVKQILKLIPLNSITKLARKHGLDKKSRAFCPTSHVLALVFGHLSDALGPNYICDTLQNHQRVLTTIRSTTSPSQNGFYHANRTSNADMAKDLFLSGLGYLTSIYTQGRNYSAMPRKFKRIINVVDFKNSYELLLRGVFWVLRTQTNMQYEVVEPHSAPNGKKLTCSRTAKWYPQTLRLIQVDGKNEKDDFQQQGLYLGGKFYL